MGKIRGKKSFTRDMFFTTALMSSFLLQLVIIFKQIFILNKKIKSKTTMDNSLAGNRYASQSIVLNLG